MKTAAWAVGLPMVVALLLLAYAPNVDPATGVPGSAGVASSVDSKPTDDMLEAASLFLKSLDDKQTQEAHMKFDDKKRTQWNFVPDFAIKPDKRRYGLKIKDMSHQQRVIARSLLNSALSYKGMMTVNSIMALEKVLFELENRPIRDTELYYFSIFGTPAADKTWGWRFEGHHLSINITLVNGQKLSVTPTFFGGNPGRIQEGKLMGLAALGAEETLARALAKSLSDAQLKKAVILEKAPADIYSSNKPKVDRGFFDLSKGIAFTDLESSQQEKLKKLVGVYISKFRPELIKQLDNSPLGETDSMVFAWGGSLEKGKGHYYRIVTKNHLIEYDNVQNGANHPHCAWREFDGDFGEDLIRKHHQHAH